MGAMVFQITRFEIVYLTVYSATVQRKHQSSAPLAFVWEIHLWPVNSPHKWPVTRKMFPFDDVIMCTNNYEYATIGLHFEGQSCYWICSIWTPHIYTKMKSTVGASMETFPKKLMDICLLQPELSASPGLSQWEKILHMSSLTSRGLLQPFTEMEAWSSLAKSMPIVLFLAHALTPGAFF